MVLGMSRRSSSEVLLAPPAHGGAIALKLPGRMSPELPRVDEHVVKPETREEMVRGERVYAQPALEPHGDGHFRLDYVLGAHVEAGYIGSTDLLTHVLHGCDFASDTCIRREGNDSTTGSRFLEEVAFEIVHTQPFKKVNERAEDWSRRGVRRIFGIFVKKGTVEEWMPQTGSWRALPPGGSISDACLVRPLGIKALLDAAAADNEVARALEVKGNPAIAAMKAASELRTMAAAVLRVLASRGLDVSPPVWSAIEQSQDLAQLERWLSRAAVAASADDAVRDP